MVCMAEVESDLESALCVGPMEVHLVSYISSVSTDTLGCHFSKDSSQWCGFDEVFPGVFVSQRSRLYAQETQPPASSVVRPWAVMSSWDIVFPSMRHAKAFFGHFGHIQCPAHVALFQLYPTSLPCHSCRHVGNQQDISCYLEQWNSALAFTIYASVASSE